MISSTSLQNNYIKLYEHLRKYIWEFEVVRTIADLEIATYKSFPDLLEIQKYLTQLRRLTSNVIKEDKELSEAFNKFEESLQEDNLDVYANIKRFREVTSV